MAVPAVAAAAKPPRARLVIDSLGAIENLNVDDLDAASELPPRVMADVRSSGLTALNLTVGYVSGGGDAFAETVRDIAKWDKLIERYPDQLLKVRSTADIATAQSTGRLGLIYGFQNEIQLGGEADRIEVFADMGVRIVQLTYNAVNALGGGSAAPENTPLTAFGCAVIDRANARRLAVDLSHSGRETCLAAARHSRQPICISHTGCRALADLPRNKSDEELRLVAERGGYVGIYFMPYLAIGRQVVADDVVRHIDHAVKVCGEDHVGIGTDGSASRIDDMARWRRAFAKQIEGRRSGGIAAAGEHPDFTVFAIDMQGPEQFRILAAKLAQAGYTEARIDKILGGNFLRYLKSVWGA